MPRNILRKTLMTLLICLPSWCAAGGARTGTVDMARLFAEYPGTKAAQARYEAVAREKERLLLKEGEDLAARRAEFKRDQASMKAKERKAAEKDLQARSQALEKRKEEYLAEMKEREDRMSKELVREIRALVAQAAQRRKVEIVFDQEKIVYARDAVDLTLEVLESFKSSRPKEEP